MLNLNDSVVRILEIKLESYKNIFYGKLKVVDVPDLAVQKGDILGIYGQNGSGKTAVISAVGLIKDIISGNKLPEDAHEYIKYGQVETEIDVQFYVKYNEKEYKVNYNVVISKGEDDAYINQEVIFYRCRKYGGSSWGKSRKLIANKFDNNYIEPKYRNEEILKLYKDNNDFIVAKKMNFEKRESYIFSKKLIGLVESNFSKLSSEFEILGVLKHYSFANLFVVDNKKMALGYANVVLPVNFKNYRDNSYVSMGVLPIGLEQPTYLPREAINEIETSLKAVNKVLNEIIPGLTIKLIEGKIQVSKSGKEEVQVELLSCRRDMEISIKYESDGIKKIVSILHLLVATFNYSSMTILIDELDSGIFEFLLGEILEIMEERGKGQLIFTSHNLRPLEVLNKKNLVFTTTNENNRFIKLKYVSANNNLRDMYYRDLILGGQDEIIYDKTNSAKIARAFREAGL